MNVTVLGTGDATGVPAPLCDCEFCVASDRRRRPSIFVEHEGTRVLLDAGPDLSEQLAAVDVRDVDAIFLTHAHGDHTEGLLNLHQTAKWDADHLAAVDEFEPTPDSFTPNYPLYMTETASEHLTDRYGGFPSLRLDVRAIEPDAPVAIGDLTVTPIPIEHHRPRFETMGFLLDDGASTALYAPDMRRFHEGPPNQSVNLLVCEGAAVLGRPMHGPTDELVDAIESVDADRVVLVNVNEHIQRAHTDELSELAARAGYELGSDFQTIAVPDET